LTDFSTGNGGSFDRTNAFLAALVFVISFVVYALTVQQSFSFWDCGEFIACAYTMGIPHPPGTPLLMLLGRVFALVPFVEDISHRINYLSVISSALTAMFSYLLAVKMIRHFFSRGDDNPLNRLIAYFGGLTGSFFVAFSCTNWANSVEAEAYGLALALSVAIVWLTFRYVEQRGTPQAAMTMVLAMYLAMVGLGIHMTVFLVVPVCAIFFVLKKEAVARDYLMVCAFAVIELLLIILFANGRGGSPIFMLVSLILGAVLLFMLYRKIHWGIVIALAVCSSVMISFSLYFKLLPVGIVALVVLGAVAKSRGWSIQWKTALVILLVGFIGFSTHFYIPIRSSLSPRIDENNPSRDWQTFVSFLDRQQYGQQSMVDRMFIRRGSWSNQFGRHPHMGFWSYFEEQYSRGGWLFVPFFALGLIGMAVAIRKRQELGIPFFTLFILCSVGLVLYMNFADGTKYTPEGGAYLEVRDRDYFFTPAFVFFGIAMGLGIAGIMQYVKDKFALSDPGRQRNLVYLMSVLVLLPGISLGKNYHINDRSKNILPYLYAKNLLDTCEENAIIFTSGDNDTFPLWCLQEVYDYRKDVRVVCLSLLDTDWYVAQMKNRYDVPISLTDKQILWYPMTYDNGVEIRQPKKPFNDRPRGRKAYLQASMVGDNVVRVQHMIVDEIVIENKWEVPIYFSSPPYAESPLRLREFAMHCGQVFRLDREPSQNLVDVEKGYDLFMNVYRFDGFENSDVYRNENATGVFLGLGMSSIRIYDALIAQGDRDRAVALMERLREVYPEYWQPTAVLADLYMSEGDSVRSLEVLQQAHDTLEAFLASNLENLYYRQDLGTIKIEIGRITGDQKMSDEGVNLIWEAFDANRNSGYAFNRMVSVLANAGRLTDLQRVARQHAEYRINLRDSRLQRILGMGISTPPPTPGF